MHTTRRLTLLALINANVLLSSTSTCGAIHLWPKSVHAQITATTELKEKNDFRGEKNSTIIRSVDEEGVTGYGIDVSFPIHHRVSTNYAWLDHNIDPDHNPMPMRYQGIPVQTLGDRQKVYAKHLEACRHAYKDQSGQCDLYEYDRLLMNMRQPQSMENYTDVGFKKIRAPESVAKMIREFWDHNHLHQKQEVWSVGNTYTNHWEAPTYMVSVDDATLRGSGSNLKRSIWNAAQETMEDWTGEDLAPCSMYGIRVYTNGSILLPHVDRLPLVASAMVNVAQDVDEDWPIEIYDHNGRAHNITLAPGDMLLFESHSIIHSKPWPLKGRYYAMMFMHFEPTGHHLSTKHNLRLKNEEKVRMTKIDTEYKVHNEDGVGGQTAVRGEFPPYIKRESQEEEHWKKMNPNGWKEPASLKSVAHEDKGLFHRAASVGNVQKLKHDIETATWQDASEMKMEGSADSGKEHTQKKSLLISKRDEHGWQPIHEGAFGGHLDVVQLLVRNGADINTRTHGGHGGTPLHLAHKKFGDHHPIVKYLKSIGGLNVGPHTEL